MKIVEDSLKGLALEWPAGGRWTTSSKGPRDESDARVAKRRTRWAENRAAFLEEACTKEDLRPAAH